MFRILLVSIYLASLLICPLRCAKSLPMDQGPSQVGKHVHCCLGCVQAHSTNANPNDSLGDSIAKLEDSGSGFPNSGCGCLTCVCKSSLYSSKETLFDDVPEHPIAIPSHPQCRVNHISSLVPDSRETRCDLRPYGRCMRQLLQSWLI